MQLVISPAKKMRADTDTLPWRDLPRFLEQAEILYTKLRTLPYHQLKALWRCSDPIAAQNVQRLAAGDLRTGLTPAILAYEGIQYRYMAPGVFSRGEFDYVQEHLRILSGLYGLLRPFDGVIPYRLEMQAKLDAGNGKNLYSYWNHLIADSLYQESDCIVNLASREYSLCISPYQRPGTRLITCVFGEVRAGRIVEKGTLCKMARGEMVRYLAERQAAEPEAMQEFSRLNFSFSPRHSDPSTYVFLLGGAHGPHH